jgi:hypothetical protein
MNAERGRGIREAEQRNVGRMDSERGRGIQSLDWGTWLWVTAPLAVLQSRAQEQPRLSSFPVKESVSKVTTQC